MMLIVSHKVMREDEFGKNREAVESAKKRGRGGINNWKKKWQLLKRLMWQYDNIAEMSLVCHEPQV